MIRRLAGPEPRSTIEMRTGSCPPPQTSARSISTTTGSTAPSSRLEISMGCHCW
ncbi:hypothetical protein T492DRAFT_1112572 [Pavlovales sp. CCMP2436]|nr:hypothetical protein T492DRAFT_1112572 [Pavlovales sp. CCMP2436]